MRYRNSFYNDYKFYNTSPQSIKIKASISIIKFKEVVKQYLVVNVF